MRTGPILATAVLAAVLSACATTKAGHGSALQISCDSSSVIKPSSGEYCFVAPAGMKSLTVPDGLTAGTKVGLDKSNAVVVTLLTFESDASILSNSELRTSFEKGLKQGALGDSIEYDKGQWSTSPAGRTLDYDGTATSGSTGKEIPAKYHFIFAKKIAAEVICGWADPGKATAVKDACANVVSTLRFTA